jgi:hypothetical protein
VGTIAVLAAPGVAVAASGTVEVLTSSGGGTGMCLRDNTNLAPAAADLLAVNTCGAGNTAFQTRPAAQGTQIEIGTSGLCVRVSTNSPPAAGQSLDLQPCSPSGNTLYNSLWRQNANGTIELMTYNDTSQSLAPSGLCMRADTNTSPPPVSQQMALRSCLVSGQPVQNGIFSTTIFTEPVVPILDLRVAGIVAALGVGVWALIRFRRRASLQSVAA